MWSKKYSTGFTIIEVVLFLAISGFLLTIVVFGMGSQMRNSRFSDSVQGIAAYVNKQYSDIQTGVNNRQQAVKCTKSGTSLTLSDIGGDLAGSSAGCMLIGRKFTLEETSIKANDIIASSDCTTNVWTLAIISFQWKHNCYYVVDGNESQYNSAEDLEFSWGTRLEHNGEGRTPVTAAGTNFSSQQTSDYLPVTGFIILRSFESGRVDTYILQKDIPNGGAIRASLGANAQLCFKGQANYPAGLYFGHDGNTQSSQNLINVKIDDSSCANWQY